MASETKKLPNTDKEWDATRKFFIEQLINAIADQSKIFNSWNEVCSDIDYFHRRKLKTFLNKTKDCASGDLWLIITDFFEHCEQYKMSAINKEIATIADRLPLEKHGFDPKQED